MILALWFVSGWNGSVELTRERLSLIKIDLVMGALLAKMKVPVHF